MKSLYLGLILLVSCSKIEYTSEPIVEPEKYKTVYVNSLENSTYSLNIEDFENSILNDFKKELKRVSLFENVYTFNDDSLRFAELDSLELEKNLTRRY